MVTYPVTLKRDLAHEPVPFVFSGEPLSSGDRRTGGPKGCRGNWNVIGDVVGFARGREPRCMQELERARALW